MEAHTSVLAKGAEHPNSHSHTLARARGVGDEAQCGALMAHCCAHGAWVLLCRARLSRVSQYDATVWRARIGSQVTWRTRAWTLAKRTHRA
ncbi:hypothetical protein Hanom_Chr12g01118711 [Helianthus anomalus]